MQNRTRIDGDKEIETHMTRPSDTDDQAKVLQPDHGVEKAPESKDDEAVEALGEEDGLDLPYDSDPTHEKPFVKKPPLYGIKPEDAASGVESFADLPMHGKVREAVSKIGWASPTPVQKLCLPYTLRGRHVAGFAQTGTGKTAVFLLTICHQILTAKDEKPGETLKPVSDQDPVQVKAVVLAPTRELAFQIEQDAEIMLKEAGLVSLCVIGGIDYDKQAKKLREGVDIVFATPGRLKDYVQKKYVDLSNVLVFVCDEADRMFDMGFIEDVEFFLGKIPEESQKLLFSATTNDQVKELAFEYLETPEYISVNPEELTPEKIDQRAYHCHATEKLRVMLGMLREHLPECAIVFTNTKLTAEWLHFKLEKNGFEADLITGDLPQKKRIKLIQRIKDGKLKVLIATDVASRGLHISRITHVYNFDLPEDPANYVHRIGRTARAGAKGFAYSLVCDDYGHNLSDINALLSGHFKLESTWAPEAYLGIQDLAGNPFADRYRAREEARSGGQQGSRSEHGRARGLSQQGRAGEGGFREGRRQDQGPPRGRGERQRGEGQGHQTYPSRHDKRFDQKRGRNHGGSKEFERSENYHKKPRSDGDHKGRQTRPEAKVGEIEAGRFSLVELIKRLWRALFGKSDSKSK